MKQFGGSVAHACAPRHTASPDRCASWLPRLLLHPAPHTEAACFIIISRDTRTVWLLHMAQSSKQNERVCEPLSAHARSNAVQQMHASLSNITMQSHAAAAAADCTRKCTHTPAKCSTCPPHVYVSCLHLDGSMDASARPKNSLWHTFPSCRSATGARAHARTHARTHAHARARRCCRSQPSATSKRTHAHAAAITPPRRRARRRCRCPPAARPARPPSAARG
jgi:hypothetical protein